MTKHRQQPEDDWQEHWDAEADQARDDATPVATLKDIAKNSTNDTARVAASKVLMDRGYIDVKPDNISRFDLSDLTGDALDRELAGFFNPGYTGPTDGPNDPATVTPAQERELRKRLRRGFDQIEERVAEATRKLAAQMAPESSDGVARGNGNVVSMQEHEAARRAELERRAMRLAAEQERIEEQRARAEAERQDLPAALRGSIPVGVSLNDWNAAWRGRRR